MSTLIELCISDLRIIEEIASVGDALNYLFRFDRLLVPSSKTKSIEDMIYFCLRIIKGAMIEFLELLLARL
jgi:hypothetical protein